MAFINKSFRSIFAHFPGLTSESILPQQAKCANIDLKDLFINAIEEVIN